MNNMVYLVFICPRQAIDRKARLIGWNLVSAVKFVVNQGVSCTAQQRHQAPAAGVDGQDAVALAV